MDYTILLHFIIAVALLSLSPGPDILYVLTLSTSKGFRAAWITAMGLVSGLIIHTLFLVFGFAELLSQFPYLQKGIQLLGAAYLIFLAIRALQVPNALDAGAEVIEEHPYKMYFQGVLMNFLNPKVSLFFLALFPGFLFHNNLSVASQFGILGLLFMGISFLVFTLVALLGQYTGFKWFEKSNWKTKKILSYAPSFVLFLLGVYILFNSFL